MRILVSIPSLSHKMARKCDALYPFHDIVPFEPVAPRNLDVFAQELKGLRPPGFFGINVPNWPLREYGGQGVAGPGLPTDELFYPASIRKVLISRAGVYDKWRPYPAQRPLSDYNVNMAMRYARKRVRMFEKAAEDLRWETLVYVEHSPASLAHLSRKKAEEIADKVMRTSVKVCYSMHYADAVLFSPYGVGGEPGFVVSSGDPEKVKTWEGIRAFLEGGRK